jgi:hypothetical protein
MNEDLSDDHDTIQIDKGRDSLDSWTIREESDRVRWRRRVIIGIFAAVAAFLTILLVYLFRLAVCTDIGEVSTRSLILAGVLSVFPSAGVAVLAKLVNRSNDEVTITDLHPVAQLLIEVANALRKQS